MALAGRILGRDFHTFVMIGDGELQEGQVWEAALFGAHHRLARLIGIIDRNGYQLDGAVDDVIGVEPILDKWRSFGWETHVVDGHDVGAVSTLLRALKADTARSAPVMILAETVKGKGVSYMETEPGWHLGYLDPADAKGAIAEIIAAEVAR
jgi:transketolase